MKDSEVANHTESCSTSWSDKGEDGAVEMRPEVDSASQKPQRATAARDSDGTNHDTSAQRRRREVEA